MARQQVDRLKGLQKSFTPIIVHNADIPMLSDLLYVMQEIKWLERKRAWQRARMTNISQHLSMSGCGGGKTGGLDDAFAKLDAIEAVYRERFIAYIETLEKAEEILDSIKNASMRMFVVMKYVFDVPDVEIMKELNMTRRSFEKARRSIEEAESMDCVVWKNKYSVE